MLCSRYFFCPYAGIARLITFTYNATKSGWDVSQFSGLVPKNVLAIIPVDTALKISLTSQSLSGQRALL